MLIQCKESLFQQIADIMLPYEPEMVEEPGTGYINCFDKDWCFITISKMAFPKRSAKILQLLSETTEQHLMANVELVLIVQKKISENEQYIFIRKTKPAKDTTQDNDYEILWGASSHINFIGAEPMNRKAKEDK